MTEGVQWVHAQGLALVLVHGASSANTRTASSANTTTNHTHYIKPPYPAAREREREKRWAREWVRERARGQASGRANGQAGESRSAPAPLSQGARRAQVASFSITPPCNTNVGPPPVRARAHRRHVTHCGRRGHGIPARHAPLPLPRQGARGRDAVALPPRRPARLYGIVRLRARAPHHFSVP